MAGHLNRQYMFKLNSTLSVDGTFVGNESRYINHAPGDQANVRAHGPSPQYVFYTMNGLMFYFKQYDL